MPIFVQIATDQLNYIYMIGGIAYLVLAYIAFTLAKEDKNSAPWRWMALFALSQVISAWVGTIDHSIFQGSMGMAQIITDWIGWVALAQFGRSWRVVDKSPLRGYWIYGVIMLAVVAGTFPGSGELIKSLLGVVVATTVIPAILQAGKNWPGSSRVSLKSVAGVTLGLMALKICLPVLFTPYGGNNLLPVATSLLMHIAILAETALVIVLIVQLGRIYFTIRAIKLGMHVAQYNDRWWIAVALPVIIVCGFIATVTVGVIEADSLKDALIRETNIATLAVSPEMIRSMTGTDADLETADYKRLYEQQTEISKVSPLYRWAYILLEKDGKIIILTDSDPVDSPDHTPVTLYSDAPPEIYEIFHTGQAKVIGPYTDRWGTWVTSLVPVIDSPNGGILAVQGIDISAEKFNSQVKRAQFQAIIISWLLAIVCFAYYYFERRLRESLRIVRQSENRYSAMVNSSLDAIMIIQDAKISYANDAALKLIGCIKEDVLNNYFTKFVHPDDHEMLLQRYTERMAGKNLSPVIEFRILKADGDVRHVETAGVKIDELGKSADLVQMHDITDRKNAETELREARRSLEDIIDSLPDSTFVVDRQCKVIAWNQAMEKMTGISKSQIIGKGDNEYSLPFYGDRRPMAINMALDKELKYPSVPLKIYREGDTVFAENYTPYIYGGKGAYLSATASILYDSSGQVKGAIETIRDFTERKQLEEEISTSNEKLKEWLEESETTKYEMMLTSEMIRKIDSCASLDEAGKNACSYIDKLFKGDKGFIAIINEESGLFEIIQSFHNPQGAREFRLSDCWATKLNRQYIYCRSEGGQLCSHMKDASFPAYIEVPLVAQNKLLGLLCIQCPLEDDDNENIARWLEYRKELINRIAAQLSLALANTQLRVSLRRQAIIDPLTSLYNRRYMHEVLENELRRSLRTGQGIGFIMGDIDNFKKFNDSYGHDIGDQLLKSVANTIKNVIRSEDIVCRYGGEEFLIILPSANLQDTYQRALQMNDMVKNIVLNSGSKKIKDVTISLGVSAYPDQGRTGDELITAADMAMYKAKREGRDRVCLASDEINLESRLTI
jgi:diguanylate cyclase (GGDEF)-like protein/PAS domain S-box-containing protein